MWDWDEREADDLGGAGAVLYVGVAGRGAAGLFDNLHAADPRLWLLGTDGVATPWLAAELGPETAERTRFFVAARAPIFAQAGDELDGGDARQKYVRSGFGRREARETSHFDRRAAIRLRYDEDALRGVLGAGQWILRPWVEPDAPGEFAVVDPLSLHELVLVFDVRIDEMKEDPALDAVVRLAWVIGWPVRKTATNQPVGIVAAAGHSLARDR